MISRPPTCVALAGDPVRGKQLFENKGGSLGCHRVQASGSRFGTAVTGRLLNIDTFTIQMLDPHENLRSFLRSDLRESIVLQQPSMPSYKDHLSPQAIWRPSRESKSKLFGIVY